MSDINFIDRRPTSAEYKALLNSVGWAEKNTDSIEVGLSNSIYSICVTSKESVIGCGRVVGDGALYLCVQDVMVFPSYQRQGIGSQIMMKILHYISNLPHRNIFVGLMAARGTETFYQRFGFTKRDADQPGMYLVT